VSHKQQLLKKPSSHTSKIGIIGLGYVGPPLGLMIEGLMIGKLLTKWTFLRNLFEV